jgi:hypothetical protein
MGNIKIIFFCFLVLSLTHCCFAQIEKNETLTFATFYPSPTGVYRTIRLYPSEQPDFDSPANQPGMMYFNKLDQTPYIYNSTGLGRWEIVGSGNSSVSSAANQFDSGHDVVPDVCPGSTDGSVWTGGPGSPPAPQCSQPWAIYIAFNNKNFTNAPKVIATGEQFSKGSNCPEHNTRRLRVYTENITKDGFWLRGGGGVPGDFFGCEGHGNEIWYIKFKAGWIAYGD